MIWLDKLLNEDPAPYDDGGAGAYNADVLRAAMVRPAFFDVSCLAYRLIYAKASEYVKNGADDARIAHHIAADVMCDVADACRHFACAPVMAFDSKFSLRKHLFAGYKAGRGGQKKSDDQAHVLSCKDEAIRLLRSVYCPTYGVQAFCVYGYESDDIIASFVLGLKQSGLLSPSAFAGQVVIVSSDHDLHQLLFDGVYWADVTVGVLCTGRDVERHTGIAVRDVVAAKCLGGCKSDAIPGVRWCGDKTLAEILQKRSVEVSVKKARVSLESPEAEQTVERNLRLIRLPFEGFSPLRLCRSIWPMCGVRDDAAVLLSSVGIPRDRWPSFGDVTRPQSPDAIPMCEWKGRNRE